MYNNYIIYIRGSNNKGSPCLRVGSRGSPIVLSSFSAPSYHSLDPLCRSRSPEKLTLKYC